ncbi:hypothetical protein SAY87_000173 [Trapa incisa]|uniref:RING-type domain-containing protein n=1 Tax=Trapa incisa TaxID=236973 RepID=A0AAN7GMV0_9MYRT|nr:hypothetical protein SAY87_000173 [Trapa incisa]
MLRSTMESSSSSSSTPPECPVCLQVYDVSDTVPRVLPCGHSACESCLGQLPQKFPQTIRCPACTQLVKFPSPRGPSSLPKNIDLLRLCEKPVEQKKLCHGEISLGSDESGAKDKCGNSVNDRTHQQFFLPDSWSDEFYTEWRRWILPQNAVLIKGAKNDSAYSASLTLKHCFLENCSASLIPLFSVVSPASDSEFRFSYLFQIMSCLSKMEEDEIFELRSMLRMGYRHRTISEIYGLWGNVEDGLCYLVCEEYGEKFSEICSDFPDGFVGNDYGDGNLDGISSFAMMGMDMCEAMISFHEEKLILGCLGLSCVEMDDFRHIYLHLNYVLEMSREIYASVGEFIPGKKAIGEEGVATIFFKLVQKGQFMSPEILLALLKKNQAMIEGSPGVIDSVSYSSDVWSVGCVLIRLLLGEKFTEETWKLGEGEDLNFSAIYEKWLENVSCLLETELGPEFRTLCQMLSRCLNLAQGCRPVLPDLWKSMRKLLTKHKLDILQRVNITRENSSSCCFILGKLCKVYLVRETPTGNDSHGFQLDDKDTRESLENDFGESLSLENVKCKELQSHLDCVTGLAIGGGFLFSSSFDRSLQLWSLQDFSHVHTFRGHEHKVMCVVYVDEEQPLCVTVDNGGGIFVWDITSSPLGNEPLKKWYAEKDWRYSGIHSLAYWRSGYLYTGGGDKLIKAWNLQDCTLACIMEGHRSVVSSLVVSEGALYSGSWDGTIRLWCLSDHSPLAVLGGDIPGKVSSILSIKAEKDLLVSVHEDGTVKVWKNEVLIKSVQSHKGAIFSVSLNGKWLFTGGWDKTINVQELSVEGGCHVDFRPVGSISCGSVITSLLSSQGKLFVGSADKTVKVYYPGR